MGGVLHVICVEKLYEFQTKKQIWKRFSYVATIRFFTVAFVKMCLV